MLQMFLSELKLYNFRRFSGSIEKKQPGLTVHFHKGLNIIVGENDAGKTAIIDAIRLMLGDVSDEFQRIVDDDFYCDESGAYENMFRIEGKFCDLSEREAGIFLDWLSFDKDDNYTLQLTLSVEKKINDNNQAYINHKLVAGISTTATALSATARSFLKTTYLKPLRNAIDELTPGFRSQLPKILMAHSTFNGDTENKENLVEIMRHANSEIEKFFGSESQESDSSSHVALNKELSQVLAQLYDRQDQSKSKVSLKLPEASLSQILKQLSLNPEKRNLGLGNMNLLYIAAELALLNDHLNHTIYGPNIMLVEELEAHLHVQAQIRLIKYIEQYLKNYQSKAAMQFILTSHSVALTASVDQRLLIYLHDGQSYEMDPSHTLLEDKEYGFLNRFLDATKANLFFAKGLIFVEGYAENILLPALADLVGYPLHEYGVSIVDVGGRSFDNYVKLFARRPDTPRVDLPIVIIRDSDIRPYTFCINNENVNEINRLLVSRQLTRDDFGKNFLAFNQLRKRMNLNFLSENSDTIAKLAFQMLSEDELKDAQEKKEFKLQRQYDDLNVTQRVFVSPAWTLEYSLLKSPMRELLLESMTDVKFDGKSVSEEKRSDFIENLRKYNLVKLYIWFENSTLSKAETAQILAERIHHLKGERRNELKKSVLQDSYCAYLINAIMFACGS